MFRVSLAIFFFCTLILCASAVIIVSDIGAQEHLDLGNCGILRNILSAGGTQSAKGTYLGEMLGKSKQKYFRLRLTHLVGFHCSLLGQS